MKLLLVILSLSFGYSLHLSAVGWDDMPEEMKQAIEKDMSLKTLVNLSMVSTKKQNELIPVISRYIKDNKVEIYINLSTSEKSPEEKKIMKNRMDWIDHYITKPVLYLFVNSLFDNNVDDFVTKFAEKVVGLKTRGISKSVLLKIGENFKDLESLALESIRKETLQAFAIPGFLKLKSLVIEKNDLDKGTDKIDFVKSIVSSEHLTNNLESLDLSNNDLGMYADPIAKANWQKLTSLSLSKNNLEDEQAIAIARADWPSLTSLDLGENDISTLGLNAILASPSLSKLKKLWLDRNQFGINDFINLFKSNNFPNLQNLNLYCRKKIHISRKDKDKKIEISGDFKNLKWLNVRGCGLDTQIKKAMKKAGLNIPVVLYGL